MQNKTIDSAILRHDIDADFFQNTYENKITDNAAYPFLYGRKIVLKQFEELLLQLPKGSSVLDVGCGTGHLTKWIKDQGYNVVGVEPSKGMREFAEKNFPDIRFINSISSEIPLADNSFDLILAFEVLRYMDESETINTYKEFHRLLKPGGKFFVTHVNKYSTDLYYFFYHLKGIISKIKKQPYHFCYFTTPKQQEKLVKSAGFSNCITTGEMNALVRLGYKFGKTTGDKFAKFIEKSDPVQVYKDSGKAMAGHLSVVGIK
ncbi:class I SAM-dependent methyltransferase [Ferruginibacter albus]|uniref:class I SAM-dependent methyltransferase n=1 Tax=Ferruginibacter albus TaxID=2875540 RepID=UPI001CC5365A|nr:class I SAM-dependent methyltransferase [Ferruginibacter albus]UAY52218.1 class I SAM-dependent methyltransferase [Ferruginibacter albus]